MTCETFDDGLEAIYFAALARTPPRHAPPTSTRCAAPTPSGVDGSSRLLEAHANLGSFLERPALDNSPPSRIDSTGALDTVIGPLQAPGADRRRGHGHGLDGPNRPSRCRRTVAIKLIKAGHGQPPGRSPGSRPSGRRWP